MTQLNNEFEKWYKEKHFGYDLYPKYYQFRKEVKEAFEAGWQAAKADSAELHATAQEYATQNAILMAKNENLEREITELKTQNSELSASINVLREALERSSKSLEAIDFDWECEHGFHQDKCPNPVCEVKAYWDAIAIGKKALASTPELKGK